MSLKVFPDLSLEVSPYLSLEVFPDLSLGRGREERGGVSQIYLLRAFSDLSLGGEGGEGVSQTCLRGALRPVLRGALRPVLREGRGEERKEVFPDLSLGRKKER